jgi:hypothetical protein
MRQQLADGDQAPDAAPASVLAEVGPGLLE